MTYRAFELADKYRNPVYLLLDGFLGTMMEPVELPEALSEEELAALGEERSYWLVDKGWANDESCFRGGSGKGID